MYHLTSVRMSIIKKSTNNKCWRGSREKRTLQQCSWECKMVQPLWRKVWRSLKKLKIELPYDPAIPLLSLYPKKNTIWKGTCTPIFTEALFTIAKTWKQPKCPSTEEWIKKMWYIYQWNITWPVKRMKPCHLHQHGWTFRLSHWVKSVRERKKNIVWQHFPAESWQIIQMNVFT